MEKQTVNADVEIVRNNVWNNSCIGYRLTKDVTWENPLKRSFGDSEKIEELKKQLLEKTKRVESYANNPPQARAYENEPTTESLPGLYKPPTEKTNEIIGDELSISEGFTPLHSPNTAFTVAPCAPAKRRPLVEANHDFRSGILHDMPEFGKEKVNIPRGHVHEFDEDREQECDNGQLPEDFYLDALLVLLNKIIEAKPAEKEIIDMDEAEDPALTPASWVTMWMDHVDGLGYNLNGFGAGVLFKDDTSLLMAEDEKTLQYIDRNNKESLFNIHTAPESLHKKQTLLGYFIDYMAEHLLEAASGVSTSTIETSCMPYLRAWFLTRKAIVFHLNIGILQMNFFQDHTKLIICPKMKAVTYIDESRNIKTYKLNTLEVYGCSRELFVRLQYARMMVERLQQRLSEDNGL